MGKSNRLTKFQWLTLVLILAYLVWEFILLKQWKDQTDGPLIRVDLLLIIPVLLVAVIISAVQYMKRK